MSQTVQQVWSNKGIPVIGVPHKRGEIRVRLPFSKANRAFLRVGQPIPNWNKGDKCWELPRAHLNRIARRIIGVFGQCYIIQTRRDTEVCAPACWNAEGVDCECSCNGEHHGESNDAGWFVVSDSFACRSGGREYAVRLIAEREAQRPSVEDLTAASGARWSTYFVEADRCLIKIGKSTDVPGRIRSLQTSNPKRLHLIGVIDADVEKEYHAAFSHLRVGGEWFQFNEYELETLHELLFGHRNGN